MRRDKTIRLYYDKFQQLRESHNHAVTDKQKALIRPCLK